MIEIDFDNVMRLSIDSVCSLIGLMSEADKLELIEALSCEDIVIKHVTDQICGLYSCTENDYRGSHIVADESFAGKGSTLDMAVYKVATLAEGLQTDIIRRQSEIILKQKDSIQKLNQEIIEMLSPHNL